MTFEENEADREPPNLGGFFILCDPLRISSVSAFNAPL